MSFAVFRVPLTAPSHVRSLNKKQQLEHQLQDLLLELGLLLENVVLFVSLCLKSCLENGKGECQQHIANDLTRPG